MIIVKYLTGPEHKPKVRNKTILPIQKCDIGILREPKFYWIGENIEERWIYREKVEYIFFRAKVLDVLST